MFEGMALGALMLAKLPHTCRREKRMQIHMREREAQLHEQTQIRNTEVCIPVGCIPPAC